MAASENDTQTNRKTRVKPNQTNGALGDESPKRSGVSITRAFQQASSGAGFEPATFGLRARRASFARYPPVAPDPRYSPSAVVWSYRSGSWCPVRRRSFAQSLTSLDARSPAKTAGGVAPVLRRHEKATRLFQSGIRRAKSHETAESPVAQWPHAPHRFDGIGQPATSPPLRRHHRRGRRADCWMGSRYARRWVEKWPPCPDGNRLKLRHALGFRERNIRELELRVLLGGDGWGVCQIIVDEREDEVHVRVLLHRSEERRLRAADREYLDSPVRVSLARPLGERAVIDMDSEKELPLYTPMYMNNVLQPDHGYRPAARRR